MQTEELEEEPDDSVKRVAISQALSPSLNLTSDHVIQSAAPMSTEEETARELDKLTGVTNVLIPVSTLELLFRCFDLLEKQLDDLKSLESRSLVSSCSSGSLGGAGAYITDSGELAVRVFALENTIDKQNSLLNIINGNCKLILDNNTALKESINNAQNGFASSLGAGRETSLDSGPSSLLPRTGCTVGTTDSTVCPIG